MKRSSKPRKQRKDHYNAPLHVRQKKMGAHLSPEIRKKTKKRSVPVRKGDKVKVIRGDHAGVTGEVVNVDLKKYLVYIDKVKDRKTNGEEYLVGIHPSNLMILDLNLEDTKRKNRLKIE